LVVVCHQATTARRRHVLDLHRGEPSVVHALGVDLARAGAPIIVLVVERSIGSAAEELQKAKEAAASRSPQPAACT
jgi:hypothetical protein